MLGSPNEKWGARGEHRTPLQTPRSTEWPQLLPAEAPRPAAWPRARTRGAPLRPPVLSWGVASRTTLLPRTAAWRMRGDRATVPSAAGAHRPPGGVPAPRLEVSLSASSSQTWVLDERPRTRPQSAEPGPGPGGPPAARAEAGQAVPSPDSGPRAGKGRGPMGKDRALSPEARPAGLWTRSQGPLPTSHVAPHFPRVPPLWPPCLHLRIEGGRRARDQRPA